MASTFTVRGNIAGDLYLFNEDSIEDNIEEVRAVGTVIENRRNPETGKYDIADPFPFTIFGRQAVNLADTVSAIKDATGKYPRVVLEVAANPFTEEGENRKGEIVDKTFIGLRVIEASISLMWHTAMIEEDEHADASGGSSRSRSGRSGRNTGRGRGRSRRDEEEYDEEDIDETEDAEDVDEAGDEEEEEQPRSRSSRSGSRSSRSSYSRSSRSSSSRSSRSSSSRSGSARSSRSRSSSGSRRRGRANYDD